MQDAVEDGGNGKVSLRTSAQISLPKMFLEHVIKNLASSWCKTRDNMAYQRFTQFERYCSYFRACISSN